MNLLDVLLIAALIVAAVRGFRLGALSQFAAFGGAVAGLVAGAVVGPPVASLIVNQPGPLLALTTFGVLLLCVAVGQGLGLALGWRLRRAVNDAGAAPADRSAGIFVGIAGFVITVWLLGAALAQGPLPAVAAQVRDSRVAGAVAGALPAPPDVFGRVATFLDQQGFPQVFAGAGGAVAPPVDPPVDAAVAAAAEAATASTVQVQATGCGAVSFGSGFVTQSEFVVTNAHVVAGASTITVRDQAGSYEATPIHVDADTDLAVLSVSDLGAPAIGWVSEPPVRGTGGATMGYPGGQRELVVEPAAVRARLSAVGRDIYGRGRVRREIVVLAADVRRGDSGGPFVTSEGLVGGVVFASAAAEPGTAYALTAGSVRSTVAQAIAASQATGTGACRF